jgi:hypothetical protein
MVRNLAAMSEKGHVWTAPTRQGIFGFLLAVGASHVSGLT